MDELWSSASYEPHLLSLPFALAPTALLLVIAYGIAMRGAPALRGYLLGHCLALLPYSVVIMLSPSTLSEAAAAQLFRFGAAFIPLAAACGTGFQLALVRQSQRYRWIAYGGIACAIGWIAIGSLTDVAVTGAHRIAGVLWYATAGRFAWIALLNTVLISAPGFLVLIGAAFGARSKLQYSARERRQLRIVLAANLVTQAGLVDVGLAYDLGVFPIGWLLSGLGSLIVLRAMLVDDLLRVRAVDTSAPRLVGLFALTALLSWLALAVVGATTWWGEVLTLAQCCIGVRVIMAVLGLVNRGARGNSGPLDRLNAQLVARTRQLSNESEIAALAADIIELGIGTRPEILVASESDYGWRTMAGERLADDRAPDPLLGAWLVEFHGTIFDDDPAREAPADLAPLFHAFLDHHGARAVVPARAGDDLLGLILVPRATPYVRGETLAFLDGTGDRVAEALVHARLAAKAETRAALAREVELAKAVQAELLPPRGLRALGGLEVLGSWRPATSCAGDFWGVYRLDDDTTLVAIGDATGHGIPSAMVTAAAVGACDAAARRAGAALDLGDLARALDRAVRQVGGGVLAMTCFAAVIDRRAGVIKYVSCGHTAPYLLRWPTAEATQPELAALVARANPLGNGVPANLKVHERPLAQGDLLVWYTDGVVDAKDPAGKPFGDRRLQQLLRRVERARATPAALHGALAASLAAHRANQPLVDDETIVIAQLGGSAP